MKLLIIGSGSISRRHTRLIHDNFDHETYQLVSNHTSTVDLLLSKPVLLRDIAYYSFDAALICNQTHKHIEAAIKCIDGGIKRLFIEKPLDCSTERLKELQELCQHNGIVTYVAYPFRHYDFQLPKHDKIDSLCIVCTTNVANWRPYQTYSALKETGGGAILELSHEIDLAVSILGSIKEVDYLYKHHQYDTPTDMETMAFMGLLHESGGESTISLDICHDYDMREVTFNLNRQDGGEPFDVTYQYSATDSLYIKQLQYFFDNADNLSMTNNIHDAGELFYQLLEMRG